MGESAGLLSAFEGRLSAGRSRGLVQGRIENLSLNGNVTEDGQTGKHYGDDSAQSNWHNATFALTAIAAGFNAAFDDLPYGMGSDYLSQRINRCSSQVLPGGCCP